MNRDGEERKFKPLVKLTGLYENVSKKTGDTYFSGYLGNSKVLVLRDKTAEQGKPGWNLFVQEKDPKPDQGQINGGYGQNQGYSQQGQGYGHKPPSSNSQPTYQRNSRPAPAHDDIPF